MDYKKKGNVYRILFKLKYFIIYFFLLLINPKYTKNDDCLICNTMFNNIICMGDRDYRFINIATFSNGDLVVETNKPDSIVRYFYGIDSKGKPLFENNQYYLSIEVNGQTEDFYNYRHESENFIATINNKEYLISISQADSIELYDLFNSRIESQVLTSYFLKQTMDNYRGSSTKINGSNDILFSFRYLDKFFLKVLKFNSTDIANNKTVIKETSLSDSKGKSVSCFMTDSSYIMCLLARKRHTRYHIYINVYDRDLDEKQNKYLDDYRYELNIEEDYFSKCLHLEKEAGIFSFVYKNDEVYNIIIFFKYYRSVRREIRDYFNIDSILLDKKNFNYNFQLNDIVKLSNKTFCFISTSITKEELYIVLLNIIDSNKILIRYYSMPIKESCNFIFYKEIRAHIYNNYISFAFSYSKKSKSDDDQNIFSSFMIFSYANGEDNDISLIDYLLENNDLNNIIIDLKENVRIDNNIWICLF